MVAAAISPSDDDRVVKVRRDGGLRRNRIREGEIGND